MGRIQNTESENLINIKCNLREQRTKSLWSFCRFWKGAKHMTTIKTFEDYLREDGKGEKTIESYVGDVRGLKRFAEERGMNFDGTLDRFALNSYRAYLLENSYEPTTINKKINSFSSYDRFLMEKGYTTDPVVDLRRDRVKIAKGSEKPVEVYDEKLIDRWIDQIGNSI